MRKPKKENGRTGGNRTAAQDSNKHTQYTLGGADVPVFWVFVVDREHEDRALDVLCLPELQNRDMREKTDRWLDDGSEGFFLIAGQHDGHNCMDGMARDIPGAKLLIEVATHHLARVALERGHPDSLRVWWRFDVGAEARVELTETRKNLRRASQ